MRHKLRFLLLLLVMAKDATSGTEMLNRSALLRQKILFIGNDHTDLSVDKFVRNFIFRSLSLTSVYEKVIKNNINQIDIWLICRSKLLV
ncbi:hypothetical protein A7K99_20145 [Tatumella citrea]|uniref:Uncharacterized protein n=1 Tax=Tatumella citrea TaxID=53336 RepID=A0A1Y0LCN6_TATCI|nr:hypothetical protein A7K98_20160 [Tatumella citrea]ARU99862.1 hypothetical protein A7K99_20145 [Tatumella citrea]